MPYFLRAAAVVLFLASVIPGLPSAAQSTPPSHESAAKSRVSADDLLVAIEQLKKLVAEQSKELEAQRAALGEQQERLRLLEQQLVARAEARSNSAAPAESPQPDGKLTDGKVLEGQLGAVADSQAQLAQRVNKLETELNNASRATESKLRGLGNFRFSGDLRLRYEPFFQEGALIRQRERFRARLNLTGNLTDEIFGGISLASGTLEDVNSTNQSFTGFLTRKTVALDRYYITYKPRAAKFLTLTGGKFAVPWVKTAMTFDHDINPEGFAETFSFDLKGPVLKNITLVGFQFPINELSADHDSSILGGQVQTQWRLREHTSLGLYAAGIHFNRADPVAVALAAGTLRPSLSNSNTFRTDTSGAVVGFASKFAYFDLIARLNYTRSTRWPVEFTFNFVNNTRAATRERSGYWTELLVGRLSEPGDLQFSYTFLRIEKDAVIGAFNESDLRASTNVRNHRFTVFYQALKNVQLHYTMFVGKLANAQDDLNLVPSGLKQPGSACATAPFTGCKDTFLKRLEFDLVYRF